MKKHLERLQKASRYFCLSILDQEVLRQRNREGAPALVHPILKIIGYEISLKAKF